MAQRTFRPPSWAILATMAGCLLMIALGVWQLQRAQEKRALDARYAQAAGQLPIELQAGAAPPVVLMPRAARARGVYLADRQMLLDNQTHGTRIGYAVWTPLRLVDGALLIVNRGWIPHTASGQLPTRLPAPEGEIEVRGLWRALPQPGLRLGAEPAGASAAERSWPRLVLYPTAAQLSCLYAAPVLPGELLLAPELPGGFLRDWRTVAPGFPPQRHEAYALQWFAMAAALLIIFIRLNLKPARSK